MPRTATAPATTPATLASTASINLPSIPFRRIWRATTTASAVSLPRGSSPVPSSTRWCAYLPVVPPPALRLSACFPWPSVITFSGPVVRTSWICCIIAACCRPRSCIAVTSEPMLVDMSATACDDVDTAFSLASRAVVADRCSSSRRSVAAAV